MVGKYIDIDPVTRFNRETGMIECAKERYSHDELERYQEMFMRDRKIKEKF